MWIYRGGNIPTLKEATPNGLYWRKNGSILNSDNIELKKRPILTKRCRSSSVVASENRIRTPAPYVDVQCRTCSATWHTHTTQPSWLQFRATGLLCSYHFSCSQYQCYIVCVFCWAQLHSNRFDLRCIEMTTVIVTDWVRSLPAWTAAEMLSTQLVPSFRRCSTDNKQKTSNFFLLFGALKTKKSETSCYRDSPFPLNQLSTGHRVDPSSNQPATP